MESVEGMEVLVKPQKPGEVPAEIQGAYKLDVSQRVESEHQTLLKIVPEKLLAISTVDGINGEGVERTYSTEVHGEFTDLAQLELKKKAGAKAYSPARLYTLSVETMRPIQITFGDDDWDPDSVDEENEPKTVATEVARVSLPLLEDMSHNYDSANDITFIYRDNAIGKIITSERHRDGLKSAVSIDELSSIGTDMQLRRGDVVQIKRSEDSNVILLKVTDKSGGTRNFQIGVMRPQEHADYPQTIQQDLFPAPVLADPINADPRLDSRWKNLSEKELFGFEEVFSSPE